MQQSCRAAMGLVMLMLVSLISKNLGTIINGKQEILSTSTCSEEKKQYTVVVDAGHGGRDGGKVGVNGILEKNVNLEIASYLREFLMAADVNVVMTRYDDNGLYKDTDDNKKQQDLNKRCSVIEMSDADCVISIHQNSFDDPSVCGPQVFYYAGSDEGYTLAATVQKRLMDMLGDGADRPLKPNDTYFLLKHSVAPMVIVECGFLSNPAEAVLLGEKDYQEQIAWSLYMGIMGYLNGH